MNSFINSSSPHDFVYIFMLWCTAVTPCHVMVDTVLIVSEILTMVGSDNKVTWWLGFFAINWYFKSNFSCTNSSKCWQLCQCEGCPYSHTWGLREFPTGKLILNLTKDFNFETNFTNCSDLFQNCSLGNWRC